jgi:hypothetical protein
MLLDHQKKSQVFKNDLQRWFFSILVNQAREDVKL